MTRVHALLVGLALVTDIGVVTLIRRQQVRPGFAGLWIVNAAVISLLGAYPDLANRAAHALGVKSPPSLYELVGLLYLLLVLVYLSWAIGRLEERARLLAEELALLRHDFDAPSGPQSQGTRSDPARTWPQVHPAPQRSVRTRRQ